LFRGPKDLPVPYAVAWSDELSAIGSALTVRSDGSGLAYRDETPQDRDRHGMLWDRMTRSPGTGQPRHGLIHTHRQRHVMEHLLCQVCGGPADRTSQGWLFLIADTDTDTDSGSGERAARRPDWPEGAVSTKPPICLPCADLALRHCPHLTDPAFFRCRTPRPWGVRGGFHFPTAVGTFTTSDTTYLPYTAPQAAWFLASHAAIQFTHCTRTAPNRP
jgi:hypothetical protein